MGLSIINAARYNQILTQRNRQSVAAKYRHLNGAGFRIVSRLVNNTSQGSSNRFVTLCHTQRTSIISDVCNEFTFDTFHCGNLGVDIIGNSLCGRNIIVGSICRNLSNSCFIQLYELHAIPNVHGVVCHAEINNALNLTSCGQGRHHLSAFGVLSCTLKQLPRIGREVQCVHVFWSKGIVPCFRTIRKFYLCHIFPPY